MSVTMQVARQLAVSQVDTWGLTEVSGYPKVYTLYEGLFTGFTGSSRTKLKRFRTIEHVFAYLNKLHAGGWMNNKDYEDAWSSISQLAAFLEVPILSS